MEFMAWFSHKYIMHGFLWSLHKDHHHKDHNSWFERNDLFFIFYAVVSVGCVVFWGEYGFTPGLAIGIGIFAYGLAYFMVHDIFIHQRFKIWRNANNSYARGVRRAHKIHHKHLDKTKGECFGMLWVPLKYFK
jgi:beta-carotene 3-hydroxylase